MTLTKYFEFKLIMFDYLHYINNIYMIQIYFTIQTFHYFDHILFRAFLHLHDSHEIVANTKKKLLVFEN